jgi:DNA-binding HxlR family transcriptional regulator
MRAAIMTEEEERINDLLEMGMIERAIGPCGEPRYRLTEEGRDWRNWAVLICSEGYEVTEESKDRETWESFAREVVPGLLLPGE